MNTQRLTKTVRDRLAEPIGKRAIRSYNPKLLQ